jgi:hypothetical protein
LGVRAEDLEGEKRTWVREEMQRLAQGLVEEERRRGSAEEGRRKVEDEVDELAASLFDQVGVEVCSWTGADSGGNRQILWSPRRECPGYKLKRD